MTKKFEIRVGMPVVLFPTGNSQYHYSKQPLKCTITKIGRKYFYVYYSGREIARFDIETFRSNILGDCNAGFDIYESMDAYLEAKEREEKLMKIRKYFQSYCSSPSIEAVRQIYDILKLP